MDTELERAQQVLEGGTRKPGNQQRDGMSGLMALHLDFVAKPGNGPEWMSALAEAIEKARLDKEGLGASVMLVSDREARVVTLLTFWESIRFLAAREYCIAWMRKLLAGFADGPIRVHSSVPQFLITERSAGARVRLAEAGGSQYREVAAD